MNLRLVALLVLAAVVVVMPASAAGLSDCAGVIRVFGDVSSWMSSCFVIGDGSWALTAADTVTEKVGPDIERTIRYPVFVSAYTGQAVQCELKGMDKELNVALLKLPVKGLPAAPLAQFSEFSKAAYGTMGQLMSGDPMGNNWTTDIYGITREKAGAGYRLAVGSWTSKKVFVTDIGDYKIMFLSDVSPAAAVPNGSMVARGSNVVGLYVNRLTITGGKQDVRYGRCAMSTEIARFASKHGLDTSTLYNPPVASVKKEDSAADAFQLQGRIYSLIGAGRADLALEDAVALAKLRPSDAQAQLVLGAALTGAGKFDEALKTFDEAAKLDPKLPGLRTSRALALIGLKKNSEAESELLKEAEAFPADSRPISALADFYLADEKTLDKALTYAQKTSSMVPESPAALLLVARAQKRLKDFAGAVKTLAEAVKMAPKWTPAWFALGATYEEGGDKDKAEKAYRKLVELQPKSPDSLLTLASFLADQGKKDEATEVIGKIRALEPPKEVLDAVKELEDRIEGKPARPATPVAEATPDTGR